MALIFQKPQTYFRPQTYLARLKAAKRVLIYGFGREGQATLNFFKKHFPEKEVVIHDDNIPEFSSPKTFKFFDLVFMSPSVPLTKVIKDEVNVVKTYKITSGTELFMEYIGPQLRKKIIGITGTKGKSTTTKFTFELLRNAGYKVELAGNYGIPLLDIYDKFVSEDLDFLVIEFSSYQLERLKVSPHIAIFLNFYLDHIDHHGTIQNYLIAKQNIWKFQTKDDYLIVPLEVSEYDPLTQGYFIDKQPANLIYSRPISAEYFQSGSVFRGKHFLENFGAVAEVAELLNISEETFRNTCESFIGLEHRSEILHTKQGVIFVDDANATTPNAAMAAIGNFSGKLGSIILGGKNRGYDFQPLINEVVRRKLFVIILKSESGEVIKQGLLDQGYSKFVEVGNMEEIVMAGLNNTKKGKICLLSMASPSYGYFKNFEEKGTLFKKYVNELGS